jgi:peptide/nickel transport system substrate-binding protein
MKAKAFIFVALLAIAPAAWAKNCGTVVLPPNADITSFNGALNSALANEQAFGLMYEQLIWVEGGGSIDWSRSLASAITSPDNGTTYDVTLRPWIWSNGKPVTSADVLYSWKLIQDLGTTYPGYGQGGMPNLIKSVTAQDATHFQVVLKHQVNPTWFIYDGLSQLQPLPAQDWSHYTLNQLWQLQSTPSFYKVVDGPLRVQSFAPGLDAVFVPNPQYPGPKMQFDRLVFSFVHGDGAELQQIEAGSLDMTPLPTEFWGAVQHLRDIRIVELQPQASWDDMEINFRNPKVAFFRDVRVRQAMADSQDQQRFIKLVLHGLGYRVRAPVTPASYAFEAPSIQQGHYPVGYDPAKARELLKQAGFTPGPDGIMQKDGKKLSFTLLEPSGSAEGDEMVEVIQADLLKVGIQMKIRQVEFNQALALMGGDPASWEAVDLGSYGGGYPSGDGVFTTGAAFNMGHYSDPKMDALIAQSVDKPGLDALYAYEIYASAQQPVIFGASPAPALLVRDRLHGVKGFYDPGGLDPSKLYCVAEGAD